DDGNNFAPRLSFAWSPFKDGRTTIRGSTGIFYEWFSAEILKQILSTNGLQQSDLVISNPGFPDPFDSGTKIVLPPSYMQLAKNAVNPYIMQSSVAIERELLRRTFLRI